jgi:hypothetical protein
LPGVIVGLEFNSELFFPFVFPSPKEAKATTDKPIKNSVTSFLVSTSLNIFW